jgi:hypothetical protein
MAILTTEKNKNVQNQLSKSEKCEKSEKSEKSEKYEKSEKSEKFEKSEKSEKFENYEKCEKSDPGQKDVLTSMIGEFGRFQLVFVLLIGLPKLFIAWNNFSTKWLAHDVDFWCRKVEKC